MEIVVILTFKTDTTYEEQVLFSFQLLYYQNRAGK